jgi:peptidoglycan/xylan/chitin deacetylase (PgdA/CDA1 family)
MLWPRPQAGIRRTLIDATAMDGELGLNTAAPAPLKRRIINGLGDLMYWSGLAPAWARARRRPAATLLMYHSVTSGEAAEFIDPLWCMAPEVFEAQVRFLARHRRVVSLSDLVSDISQGRGIAPGTVVLTFDDGYLDNLEVAAPILDRYELPATLYLPTGYIARSQTQWVDELYSCFAHRSRSQLELPGVLEAGVDLDDDGTRIASYGAISGAMMGAYPDDRAALFEKIRAQLCPTREPPRLTLDWDGVRQLVGAHPGWEIGVHTVEHIDATQIPVEGAEREFATSVADVEREIGQRPRHLSFPYGRSSPVLRDAAAAAGFDSAVAVSDDLLIDRDSDVFWMGRIDPRDSMTRLRFRTSGAYPEISQRLIGRY